MEIEQFHIVGINYKKTDTSIRGQFALSNEGYANLLLKAQALGINSLFVLSTCNRTEIYGIAPTEELLTQLLCSQTQGDIDTFKSLAYHKTGAAAIEHYFHVSCGLDSQILGDYEIVGQIKQAVKFAKAHNCINAFLERLSNTAFQTSKAIKNQTELSGGTVSVAFAAIQFLRLHCTDISEKKFVLIGTGKIGHNTCKNLIDYLGAKDITLINRSQAKAQVIADELGLQTRPFEQLQQTAAQADIVIVATNAPQPILFKTDLESEGKKILIDLSVPHNIDLSVKTRPHTIVVNVDDLSKLGDATLKSRQAEIPKALQIIDEYLEEFKDWYQMRKNVPIIRAAKQSLMDIHHCSWFQSLQADNSINPQQQEDAIKSAIKNLAVKMRSQEQTPGCAYIETLHDFLSSTAVSSQSISAVSQDDFKPAGKKDNPEALPSL
ncbi:glutamyl-tRNA reductase [Arachidicoccus rhizosphaerae]|uniref:Glutamyl-tRNA reductase n=1 Tax=Arachidicoccus rhizosphaerae TaxID=551991 RepID=A0A1H3VK76_9BACT|nr:glutamyl-tRNA reductase [Arachidicoccus rhizosphaerae]SDZ75185.1 glutamyl-tRNA reductase [Arachidicoccus rhizosphaerae]